jgi:hypothetical protein
MKNLLLACMALFILASCDKKEEAAAAPAGTNVHISGNVKGFKQGRLFLARIKDTVATVLDTIDIKGNSSFSSHLKLDSPEMLFLVIDRGSTNSMDDNLRFFVEPGDIKIETTLEAFYADAVITGSENQKLYEEFLQYKKRFTDKNVDLEEMQLNAELKKDFAKLDSVAGQKKRNTDKRFLATANYAFNHPDKEIAPYLAVYEIPEINVKYLIMIDDKLTPKIKASRYGKELKELIAYKKKNDPPATVQPEAIK